MYKNFTCMSFGIKVVLYHNLHLEAIYFIVNTLNLCIWLKSKWIRTTVLTVIINVLWFLILCIKVLFQNLETKAMVERTFKVFMLILSGMKVCIIYTHMYDMKLYSVSFTPTCPILTLQCLSRVFVDLWAINVYTILICKRCKS